MIKYFTTFLLTLFIFSCGYPDIDNVPDFKDAKLTDEELLDFCKDYDGRANLIRNFSNQAVNEFEDESLDFVFIDASHDFHSVNEDIYLWKNKVNKGGMVSGHDIDLLQVKMAVSNHKTRFETGPDNVWWWIK